MSAILLIDDDQELTDMLKQYLQQEGFEVSVAANGQLGLEALAAGSFVLVVLDVMMPVLNGIDTLREIRRNSDMPVIMLTARGDDLDRVVGLELGADDYVPKPCTPRELMARIRAVLRRTQAVTAMAKDVIDVLEVGQLRLWSEKRQVEWKGQSLELTGCEFGLLEALARGAGKPVSKDVLSQQGLGKPLERFDRSVDVHISSIRQKLGPMENGQSYIQTVYRQGYQLIQEG